MPHKLQGTNGYNRKSLDQSREWRQGEEKMRALYGMEPAVPPPPPALPPASSRASRPDLYPAFVQGVASTGGSACVTGPAGAHSSDTNVDPTFAVATSGSDRRRTTFDRSARATRKPQQE